MKNLTKIFGAIVPTFFTTTGGVSISEVSRRQAEAKQQNDEFWNRVTDAVGGVFRKVISFVGGGSNAPQAVPTSVITREEIAGYAGVAERNAGNTVLMHGVKLFKRLQESLERMDLRQYVTENLPTMPARPEQPPAPQQPTLATLGSACSTERFMELSNIDQMIEQLQPEVLAKFSFAFWKKANELNSRAAVIGKLLSEQGSLFRELIRPLPKGTEQVTQTGVVITRWEKAYNADQLAEFSQQRDALQAEYNDLQKQLNGLKKQIKDAVRAYNLDEERRYQSAYGEYQLAYAAHQAIVQQQLVDYQFAAKQYAMETERVRSSAETFRQQALQELATLKVRTE